VRFINVINQLKTLNMKRFRLSKILLMGLVAGSMLFSCSDENSYSKELEGENLRSNRSNDSRELFTVSYEIDITMLTQFDCE
jgi:hypothetical protein